MAASYRYSVLQVMPSARRGERVNVGLVIFRDSGVDVRIAPSLNKVAALDGTVDLQRIIDLPEALAEVAKQFSDVDSMHALFKEFGFVTATDLGSFEITQPQGYEWTVNNLMKSLVLRVGRPPRQSPASTRLMTELKGHFRRRNLPMGTSPDDINNHLIVPRFPLDPDENLFTDFMVKNGIYRATETADFRAESAGELHRARIAGLAAVKLDKAKKALGAKTKRYVVYAARKDARVSAQLGILGDYADHVFDANSRSEMAAYLKEIEEAVGQPSLRPN